ncbi:MAG: hydrolase [Pantoea eucrina]|nr:hydrolase [Pantoea eucrina]
MALEINNSSFTHSRPGSEPNCRAIAEAVRDAGGQLAFGSDSHTVFTLGHFEHCLRITREVDFPEDRVLNVTPRRLLDFLEQRSGKRIAELLDF